MNKTIATTIRLLMKQGAAFRAILSIFCGLAAAAILMKMSGYNPLEALSALWIGASGMQSGPIARPGDIALGGGHIDSFTLAQSLARVTPLIFCGLAVAIAMRAGLFNIGVQGQMTVGALAAAYIGTLYGAKSGFPPVLYIFLIILGGAGTGAIWAAIAGILKSKRGVHEVLTTMMLNFVGTNLVAYIVTHNLKDPNSQNEQTVRLLKAVWLTPIVPHSNLTAGLLLAVFATLFMTFLMSRTSLGFGIRAVGESPEAAEASGISVPKTITLTMALSGALAGAAGALEVLSVHHRFVDGLAATYGYDGISVALLGGLGGFGVLFSALFFGLLASGASYMESVTHVPAPISIIVQAFVILFVGMRLKGKQILSILSLFWQGAQAYILTAFEKH